MQFHVPTEIPCGGVGLNLPQFLNIKILFNLIGRMFFPALLILAGWGLCGSVSASPAVEAAYAAVLSVVSPGQQYLTGDSLHTVFNTLEKRVQCGEVSCEKVSFIMLSAADR